jgi:hypothetical protein
MAQELSEMTKSEKVAKNLGFIAKKFNDITKNLSDEDTEAAAKVITDSTGVLNGIGIGYSNESKSVTVKKGGLTAKWNPNNGDVSFGLSSKT